MNGEATPREDYRTGARAPRYQRPMTVQQHLAHADGMPRMWCLWCPWPNPLPAALDPSPPAEERKP